MAHSRCFSSRIAALAGKPAVTGLAQAQSYQLMLSARANETAGQDAYVVNYNSFGALVNSPSVALRSFSGIDISSAYIASGLSYVPAAPMPEPSVAVHVLRGLGGVAAGVRRRR